MADTNLTELKGMISFPCHSKYKAMVFKGAQGMASYTCPQCHGIAVFDFARMTAWPAKMIRGATHKFANS